MRSFWASCGDDGLHMSLAGGLVWVLWRSARSRSMTILKNMADTSWNWLGQRAQRDEVDEEVDEVVSAIKD